MANVSVQNCMSWSLLYYGTRHPSRARRLAVNALMLTALLGVYGIWTDFVPSATWSKTGLVISVLASGALAIGVCRGYVSGHIPYGPTATTRLRRGLVLLLIPPFVFGLAWLVVVRSVPDLLTRWREPSHVVTVTLRKGRSYSRRTCDNQIRGDYFGFIPGHVCVSDSAFRVLPEEGPMTISGSSSIFGVHVHSITPARANNLLEPTLEANAAQQ
jgi:hypothetical protein